MRLMRISLVGLIVAAIVGPVLAAPAVRQYYAKSWSYNPKKSYHYREYYYKPKPTDTSYQKQYVIYYKNDAKKKNWVYYYSPKSEKVWCRYPTTNHPTYGKAVKEGKELWSVLPKEKRHKDVYEINDNDYGKVGVTCPVIPETNDEPAMQLPPSDLP